MSSPVRTARILLVEDSPTDALLTREALASSRVLNEIHLVTDGEQALAFLRHEGAFADAPDIDLILLDLNLPRRDGREVLEDLKQDEALKRIPVVVLTSSSAEADILQAYGLHANCYIVKPVSFERFAQVVATIDSFWLAVVALPRRLP